MDESPLARRISAHRQVRRLVDKGPVPVDRFTSPLHDERTAAILGVALGVSFGICFLTGILSHYIQHPPGWFTYPSRPLNFYRITQGVHVATGIASIPLLLAKLWTVYPKFWAWPPIESVGHAIERISIIPLVAGALFQLASGVADIYYWYTPMPFNFTVVHFWVAWITIGALLIHIGAKIGTARIALSKSRVHVQQLASSSSHVSVERSSGSSGKAEAHGDRKAAMSRRELLTTVGVTSAVMVVSVVGETAAPLKSLSVLGPRDIARGPEHLPVNQSAQQANVIATATDPAYRLQVVGKVRAELSITLEELLQLPSRQAGLPITCVEGWSVAARWKGVSIGQVLSMAGAPKGARAEVISMQSPDRLYRSSFVNDDEIADPDTLIAYELNGDKLDLDHGYPVRLIGPNRPGVMQTKWIQKIVVS